MRYLVLFLAIVAANGAFLLFFARRAGSPKIGPILTSYGFRLCATLATIPAMALGSIALAVSGTAYAAALGAAVGAAYPLFAIRRKWRSVARINQRDGAHIAELVAELSRTRPASSDGFLWEMRVNTQARSLALRGLCEEAVTLLKLFDWSELQPEQRAAAGATACLCNLAAGAVPEARKMLEQGRDAPPECHDALFRMLDLRLLPYEAGADTALDRLPEVEALARKDASLRHHELAFRAHASAARGDDAGAMDAIRKVLEEHDRELALFILTVPIGPATEMAKHAASRGAYR